MKKQKQTKIKLSAVKKLVEEALEKKMPEIDARINDFLCFSKSGEPTYKTKLILDGIFDTGRIHEKNQKSSPQS
jgi:hypothetical protein